MLKSSVSWLNTVNRSLKFQPDVLYQQGIPVGRPPCYQRWVCLEISPVNGL